MTRNVRNIFPRPSVPTHVDARVKPFWKRLVFFFALGSGSAKLGV